MAADKKQPSKTRPFSNRNTIKFEVAGMEGDVTIPVILEDVDLAKYIEYMESEKVIEEQDILPGPDEEPIMVRQIRVRHESRRHMVKAITFPGVTIENYKPGGKHPYPALVFAIGDILDQVVRDALNLPNS